MIFSGAPSCAHVEHCSADDLIGTDEVAALCGVPVSTVRYWRAAGFGPHGARMGRRVKYRRRDVDAWVSEHFTEHAAEQVAG